MRSPSRREMQLRTDLQVCQSRIRLALAAVNATQRHVLNEMRYLSIEQTAPLMGHLESVRLLLGGEVVQS